MIFATPDELPFAVGVELGTTGWTELTPAQLADYTGATGEVLDGTVPPWLLLALTNLFMPDLIEVQGVAMGVNYGTAEVRFPTPAPVGARLRASAQLTGCDDVRGGVQTTVHVTVEAEGIATPVCTVDSLSRWLT